MSFTKDDTVVLSDKHSEYDGETGTITQVMETMFGEATYTVSFEDGQETGVPADALTATDAEGEGSDDTDSDDTDSDDTDSDDTDSDDTDSDNTDTEA